MIMKKTDIGEDGKWEASLEPEKTEEKLADQHGRLDTEEKLSLCQEYDTSVKLTSSLTNHR